MRVVLQRVCRAHVEVDGVNVGSIEAGILILLGISRVDNPRSADYLVDKIVGLRIFEDDSGKMNRSVRDIQGGLLIVPQFTLYGDCSKGRRPSFDAAAPAIQARELYDYFVERARREGLAVATGQFQASMRVYLENDGPVTLVFDSPT